MIDKSYKDKILDGITIEDVVSKYVPDLKRSGRYLKACCPFHNEKTPSFFVMPDKGKWRCYGACQEGGNVIDFVMKADNLPYPLACKKLLKEYLHIDLKEAELHLTPEEEKQEKLRQTMLIYTDLACKWFVEQFNADYPAAKAAKAYAVGRWGEEYCKENRVGFAPDSWDMFVDWATGKGLDTDVLSDLVLIKYSEKAHKHYAFFRNRVMLPICDRYGKVIGFTGRTLDEHEDCKYINSANSLIYKKEVSIFGIENAIMQARKEEKMFLGEGAPDAAKCQSLGINNVVASLGGAWTIAQLEFLKGLNVSLCFLPDSDPLKNGETIGAGFRYVIKNGTEAIKMGFAVSVREIPNDTGKKMDPDSYITSAQVFNSMDEEEFILWYARINWNEDFLAEDRVRFIGEVCDLIACLKDENVQETYINALVKKYHNRPLWTSGMRSAKRRMHEEKTRRSSKEKYEMLQTYGFTIKNNCYYSSGKDGAQKQLSNFILTPCIHVVDDILPLRIFWIVNDEPGSKQEIIEFDMDTFTSSKNMRKKLLGKGNYLWYGDENDLLQLQAYLAKTTETARQVKQMGWQKEGFYCFCNGVLEDGVWIPVDNMGIVRLKKGNFYIPAMSELYKDSDELFINERKFIHLNYSNISFRDYFEKVIGVFGDNAKVGLGWLCATFFRDIVKAKIDFFPIYNVFGPKGSGKTQLGTSLNALVKREHKPTSIGTGTLAGLTDELSSVSNAPVHLDEYKNTVGEKKVELLKDVWAGIGRVKMNMDKDKKREQARVNCGLIITGQEMPTADIALFTRLIFLTYDKQHHTKEERDRYDDLVAVRQLGLSHLAIEILKHRTSFEASFDDAWKKAAADIDYKLDGMEIMDRIERNWLVPLAAFIALEKCLDMPFSYEELLEICAKGIKRQNSMCSSTDEVAAFWNIYSTAQQKGLVKEEQDFMLRMKDKLKVNQRKEAIEFTAPTRILMIRRSAIRGIYCQLGRQMEEKLLPPETMLFYLMKSDEFIGTSSTAQRFRRIGQNGQYLLDNKVDSKGNIISSTIITERDRPLCFDYDRICQKYGIFLDSSAGEEYVPAEDEEKQTPKEEDLDLDDKPF